MEDQYEDAAFFFDKLSIDREDLLQSLSWLCFIPENSIEEKDKRARDNLLKVISYLTRNDL